MCYPILEGSEFVPIDDPAQIVFSLFEGQCPKCGKDVDIKEWSGTRYFLREHPAPDGVESIIWSERYGTQDCGDEIGGVTFVCPDGHWHYIGYGRHGDWMC